MTTPGQFTIDYEGIRKVALDVDVCGRDMQVVRATLAGLGDPAQAVFGEFGVPEAMCALIAAWREETAVLGDGVIEFAGAIRRAADHYREADQRAAGRVEGMWGH
jgi:uncharacterized protein YukE